MECRARRQMFGETGNSYHLFHHPLIYSSICRSFLPRIVQKIVAEHSINVRNVRNPRLASMSADTEGCVMLLDISGSFSLD